MNFNLFTMEDLGQGREEGGRDGGCPRAECAKDVRVAGAHGARSFQMLGDRAGTLACGAWSPLRSRGGKTVRVVPVPASPSYRGSPAGGVITHKNLKFPIKKAVQRR